MSVNKVILIGNLGRDPELRHTENGNAVANLSLATTRKWKNKQTNEMVEETEWHRVNVYGRLAEVCNEYLAKGKSVYVEGRIKTRSYEKDGQKHFTTEIIAEEVKFLGGGGQRSESGGSRRSGPAKNHGGAPEPYDPGDYGGPDDSDDSIPF